MRKVTSGTSVKQVLRVLLLLRETSKKQIVNISSGSIERSKVSSEKFENVAVVGHLLSLRLDGKQFSLLLGKDLRRDKVLQKA